MPDTTIHAGSGSAIIEVDWIDGGGVWHTVNVDFSVKNQQLEIRANDVELGWVYPNGDVIRNDS